MGAYRYNRVLPRDLFNESKLLKCLGQVSLLIHDGKTGGRELELIHDTSKNQGFVIDQDPMDGGLFCSNIKLVYQGRVIPIYSIYNNKGPFPMNYRFDIVGDGYAENCLFEDDGSFTEEFLEWLDTCR